MTEYEQFRQVEHLLWGLRYLLAALVFGIAVLIMLNIPEPYPTWPTIGPFPVDPELLLPALLAVLVLVDVGTSGISVGGVVTGTLAVLTLWMASQSLYALYADQASGVFWGGFFSIVLGTVLALSMIARDVVRLWSPDGLFDLPV